MKVLIAELEQAVANVPVSHIPTLLGVLATIQATAQLRMHHQEPEPARQEERLLTIEEAAQRLNMTKDYLYRNANKFPFIVRPAPRQVRVSLIGLERYIKTRSSPH